MTASISSPEERLSKAGISSRASTPRRNGHDAAAPQPRPLSTLSLSDCEALPVRGYLVKGLFAPGDLVVMHGAPGTGKSVLAPLIAHAVASGTPVFGRRVRQGPVLYIAAEDPTGMQMRFQALQRHHGDTEDLHLLRSSVAFDLEASHGLPPDVHAIIALADQMGAVLIVIDTLSRIASGWEENDSRSTRRLVDCLRALCGERRAVLAVHHSAKAGPGSDGGSTPRGHSVLNGDADVTLRITWAAKTSRSKIELGKNRNGPSSGTMTFDIEQVSLGTDEDGDPITSVVAKTEHGGAIAANDNHRIDPHRPATLARDEVAPSLNATRTALLAAIRTPVEAGATSGAEPEAGEWVTRDQLIGRLVASGWFRPEEIRQDQACRTGSRHPVGRKAQTRLTKELNFLRTRDLIAHNGGQYRAA
jgi:hypothetical protein